MSHGCWGFGSKADWILPLGIQLQVLEEAPLPEWEPSIPKGGQIITLLACFAFKIWVLSFGEVYTETVKIICRYQPEDAITGHSDTVHWVNATEPFGKQVTRFALSRTETEDRTGSRVLASQLPNLSRNHKTLPPSSHGHSCAASLGEGKKQSVLANWKMNSVAKAILFPNF